MSTPKSNKGIIIQERITDWVDLDCTSPIPSRWAPWCALQCMLAAQNQNWIAQDQPVHHWCHEVMKDMDDIVLHQLVQINENTKSILKKWEITLKKQVKKLSLKHNSSSIPVMRLLGSKISIFSSRSNASGDIFGNLAEKFCFLYCGSCRTYLLAFPLRRNPRLASSGEPNNF